LSLRRHLGLIVVLAKRDVAGRYRGSAVGLLWSLVNPLLMLTVYTFVFSMIFKARWGTDTVASDRVEFALVLFVGLIVHNIFAECANRAPTLIISNPSYVKKVVFPLETLAWVTAASAFFHGAISALVLVGALLLTHGSLPWTAVLFPGVLLLLLPFVLGSVWLLSSLGVFLRDLQQVIGVVIMLALFLAPVFYPVSAVPEPLRSALGLNPLTYVIETSRSVLIWGRLPELTGVLAYLLATCVFAWGAFAWFERTRKGFADVL
jgi:lipopolysaccharide transport system permease protein